MNTETYKHKLEEEKKLIETELGTVAVHDDKTGDWQPVAEDQGGDVVDENDLGDKFESLEQSETVTAELELRLADIARALEKIATGTFGKCEVCEKEIEAGRLDANPASRTCVEHREHAFN